ncbi:MAG: HD-GYP domain-containing protein [Selenomonadaceae bacterium]|uniref:HD-GYP domain-containing protein n=1 Tax=Selenomonas bovis TaxID=416586 RepID=UPI0018CC2D93|nr:HD-GYP domain-containing protein [Selenomonas bovis]MDY6271636.1 HD-GYP domain-containing protein [Selenomonadaceae bacterium]MDY6299776.1 HD-GYP domain-containing protein [Selenomonadaceae bacterium]
MKRRSLPRQMKEALLYCGLGREEYAQVQGLVLRRNHEMLRLISLTAAVLGYLMYLLSFASDTLAAARYIYFIEGTFAWLVYDLAVRFVRPRWVTLLLGYLCMEITFLLVFAMSFTSWHRWVPVTSVVVLLSVLPLLFIDRPWRMQSFVFLNAAGFLLYDIQMMTKPQKFIELDVINVVFYCVVEFICYYLLANIMMRGFSERCKNDAVRQGMIENLAYIIENRDENTGGHVQRTSRFIEGFVQQVVQDARYRDLLGRRQQEILVHAAPLHDIGKIKISDLVLNKPGRLTEEEFAQMKLHTVYGARMIRDTIRRDMDESFYEMAYHIALSHHERYDGKGYPQGLRGEEIPLEARIMALVDVYDALVSERVYKPAIPREKALAIIREGRGTQFDPNLTDIFLAYMEKGKC